MKIAYLAAGSGSMYCGACARDAALIRELIALGHQVQVVPLYTPLRIEDPAPLPTSQIFYGGINVYLQQMGIDRFVPAGLGRLLDHPALLRLVSSIAIETNPAKLGPMTVSVLAGRDGRQQSQIPALVEHVRQLQPDVISISSSLLLGPARELKRQVGAPIVCTLQGEDQFVAALPAPYDSEARRLIQRNAGWVDCFISPARACADLMAEFLSVDRERIEVVPTGLAMGPVRPQGPRPREPFILGYLSVIRPEKGLDLLVEALRQLVRQEGRHLRLRVAGKVLDRRHFRQVTDSVRRHGLSDRFEHLGEVDYMGKVRFLEQCSAFCVPSRLMELRGIAVMEALAAGRPVVAPESGVFPELLAATGGGLLFPRGDAAALARQVARLMDQPDEADRMGRQAAQTITRDFTPRRMAERMLDVYAHATGAVGVGSSSL